MHLPLVHRECGWTSIHPALTLIRGIVFTHEAVRDWEARLAPLLAEGLRQRRAGKAGRCWYVDETYLKIAGEWCYLYRAIDRDGNLVDVYLSETRDMAAAKAFFRSAKAVTRVEPQQVTTDGHTSYPKAIAGELGTDVDHRTSQYKNNVIEQNHRGIKGRYRPMRGFKIFKAAHRFCRAFDEVRNFLRPTSYINQNVSLARQRVLHVERVAALRDLISVA
ncbi:IS6 family transposase [Skermanella sp. TT6]|nr:IS6 family transposase [Skermanella sp. TT6]